VPSSLGERIRARRQELGLTQADVAGNRLSKGFISLIEMGRAKPSIETLRLLAKRLQKPVGYFVEGDTSLSRKALHAKLASAWISLKRAEFTQAAEIFAESRNIAKHHKDVSAEADSYIGLASALAGLRQFDAAQRNVRRGKELAEAAQSSHHLARVSQVLGLIEYYRGNLAAAQEHFLEGHNRAQRSTNPDLSLAGSMLLNLGNAFRESGDYTQATKWYREALKTLEPTHDLPRIGLVHVQLGAAQRQRGNYDGALAHFTRAEHIFEILEDIRLLAQARNSIGIMLLQGGEIEEAITHFKSSLAMKERVGDDPGRARTLTELARALAAKGLFADAQRALAESERLTQKLGDVTEHARVQLARARIQVALRRFPDAIRQYETSIAVLEKLGMRTDLVQACNELGELLIQQKRPSEAAAYLSKALHELRTEPHAPITPLERMHPHPRKTRRPGRRGTHSLTRVPRLRAGARAAT
jgi:tetratricopeptide (TPR) repeat protein